MAFYSSVQSLEVAWDLGDVGVGSTAWLTFIAILLLTRQGLRLFNDYEAQHRAGKVPVFDPKASGFSNTQVW